MIKRYLPIVLFIIILTIIIYLLNILVNLINLDQYWFMKLTALSTALAAVGSITLLALTFIYVLTTRQMVEEMRKQRESVESPAVTVKILPDKENYNFLNILLRNTGGSAAYGVSIRFDPDLPYGKNKTVNSLNIFNNMPILDKGEEIEVFFAGTIDYFNSNNPKSTKVEIQYYKSQQDIINKEKPTIISYVLNIEERKGERFINLKSFHDLVNEIEELKHSILMLLAKEDEK